MTTLMRSSSTSIDQNCHSLLSPHSKKSPFSFETRATENQIQINKPTFSFFSLYSHSFFTLFAQQTLPSYSLTTTSSIFVFSFLVPWQTNPSNKHQCWHWMFLASLCTAIVYLSLLSPLLPLTYSQHIPTTVLSLSFLCLISCVMVSISAASASTSSLSSYASLNTSEPDKWFSIHMQDPFVVLTPQNNSSSSSSSLSSSTTLNGTIYIRLSKPTKVRSLSLNFSGFARTSFRFDPTRIPGAKACASIGMFTVFIVPFSFVFLAAHTTYFPYCFSFCFFISRYCYRLAFSTGGCDESGPTLCSSHPSPRLLP